MVDIVSFMPTTQNALTTREGAYRSQPSNREAEQALLGAILVNNKAFEKTSEFLRAEHFFDPVHVKIFSACATLIERGQIANPLTLKPFFEHDGQFKEVGGVGYLADLAASVVTIVNAEDYGRLLHDLHLRRALINIGEDLVNEAYAPNIEETAMQQIEQAEAKLFDLASTGEVSGGFVHFERSLKEALATAEKAFQNSSSITGITTGLRDMDRKLGGLQRSDLLILAARPSMGKTSLVTNIAFNAAKAWLHTNGKEGCGVAFFSLEMSAEQLANRILSDACSISSEKIRRGEIRGEDFPRIVEAAKTLYKIPLWIDDTPALSIAAMRTRCRRIKRTNPELGLIVVDYLQLLRGSNSRSNDSRVNEVSEITRGLKAIAKELDIPVVALSQLSRSVEQREDKKPMLSDLRESGSIEQDADVVMFIYRQEYYLAREEPTKRADESDSKFDERYTKWQQNLESVHNIAEVIIAKQRHGPIGTVPLHFDGMYTRFSDLDRQYSGSSYD